LPYKAPLGRSTTAASPRRTWTRTAGCGLHRLSRVAKHRAHRAPRGIVSPTPSSRPRSGAGICRGPLQLSGAATGVRDGHQDPWAGSRDRPSRSSIKAGIAPGDVQFIDGDTDQNAFGTGSNGSR
jgi:hypothetical protein